MGSPTAPCADRLRPTSSTRCHPGISPSCCGPVASCRDRTRSCTTSTPSRSWTRLPGWPYPAPSRMRRSPWSKRGCSIEAFGAGRNAYGRPRSLGMSNNAPTGECSISARMRSANGHREYDVSLTCPGTAQGVGIRSEGAAGSCDMRSTCLTECPGHPRIIDQSTPECGPSHPGQTRQAERSERTTSQDVWLRTEIPELVAGCSDRDGDHVGGGAVLRGVPEHPDRP